MTICICGAGTMGSGIAQVCATAGFNTMLFDVSAEAIKTAEQRVNSDLSKLVSKEKITIEKRDSILTNLRFTSNIADCKADVIIEAIIEKPEIKIALFNQLADINSSQTIFASNTSSLSISSLAKEITNPERVAGLHFFNPAPLMKLVEVVSGEQTSENVLQQLVDLTKALGKVPVVCKDSPGFIVNRVARPFYIEALRLAEEGQASYEVIDRLLESKGFKLGPFKLMDLIGNDINYAVSCSVYEQLGKPERLKPSYLQKEKVDKGELGRKTGKGYYTTAPLPPKGGLSNTQLPPVNETATGVESLTSEERSVSSLPLGEGRDGVCKASAMDDPPLGGRGAGLILITGGTGFLGSYIIKNLVEKGQAVRAIRRSAKLPFYIDETILKKVEWVEGDVLDVVSLAEAMDGVDSVVHSAAIVSFAKDNRKEMYQVNIEGTTNVVNVALETGVKKILHVSSVAALGRLAKAGIVSEQKLWEESKNNTHYAITKNHAEMQVWRGFAEGLEGAIINPSTILGFGNWHQSSCAIFKNAYKSFPWFTKGVNGFVGVEDVAEAAVQLLLSEITEKRFIVNAENCSFQSLFTLLAEGFGKTPPHRYANKTMSEIAWRMESIKSLFTGSKPLLSKETTKVAHSLTSFDNSALLNALPGFSFTPLHTVIKQACDQYGQAVNKGLLTL